ncbi:acyl-CoA dehydrogenase family protein [Sandaracinus amylolyticus]|uniref:Putative acyl-CoA dehydrogenase n=1 Tax=Sandaracinus amylolyticus TaxID=927083 RepID=A0A0F6YHW5_9BACT|nr:acyl-CoA dehydrogenase family protein [Sandaracinus amylolyticus]AKF05576.1 Putative acyl-CoA dehydrogenase [Sandaracinus amylolyticus]
MKVTPFNQPPPALGNQYDEDRPLRSLLARIVPRDALLSIEPALRDLGELAGGELYRMQLDDRENDPKLVHWDAWGNRIDHIEVSPLWKRAERIAAEKGLVATAYERRLGALSRVHQFSLVHLFGPATDIYACPLAMTDGAARTLLESGNAVLAERAVPRLTSRDPDRFWTSGQWMTESTGGSDVGRSETVATKDESGQWRLWGRKWFTSATTAQMSLTLARPEGNGPGGRGLALFYVETRDQDGRLRNILVHRLKDKLGTRKVPTAELTLDGTPATPVIGLDSGTKYISPMLNVTRTWNTVMAVAGMRRGVALARDYATKRVAFGAPLSEKPLHVDTLAGVAAEYEAALQLAFFVVQLHGRIEAREASDRDVLLARLLTPIAKLVTGKQAVAVASEVLESFGGAGYVEDTGLPVLLRDAQVLPIWEGTTNVLSLDTLRALGHGPDVAAALEQEMESRVGTISDTSLREVAERARGAVRRALGWLASTYSSSPLDVEGGARRFALTLGRSLELLLLAHHADWSLRNERDARSRAAALRFARAPFDLVEDTPVADLRALANDEPLAV